MIGTLVYVLYLHLRSLFNIKSLTRNYVFITVNKAIIQRGSCHMCFAQKNKFYFIFITNMWKVHWFSVKSVSNDKPISKQCLLIIGDVIENTYLPSSHMLMFLEMNMKLHFLFPFNGNTCLLKYIKDIFLWIVHMST